MFVDDDVRASPGWLRALLGAAGEHADVDVFTGPIRASLEGVRWRSCGRERPPITTLDLGPQDTDTRYAWGANMAIRRAALERVGRFDESLKEGGDEQEWQDRLRSASGGSGRVLYVAAAAVEHRRAGRDARLRALSRGAAVRGRAARRFDALQGRAPTLARESLTLAGCAGHVVRYGCPAGLTMVAHSAGRLREALREPRRAGAAPAAVAADAAIVPAERPTASPPTISCRAAAAPSAVWTRSCAACVTRWPTPASWPAGGGATGAGRAARAAAARVLVLGVERAEHRALAEARAGRARALAPRVELHATAPEGRGKFENLNRLLDEHPADGHDWLLVLDDDVELPRGFLDRFLFLCERFELSLAQPAHRLNSHAAWPQTRRVPGSVVRETRFVEIGPVTAFAARHVLDAAAVPRAAHGLGPGRALGGAGAASTAGAAA